MATAIDLETTDDVPQAILPCLEGRRHKWASSETYDDGTDYERDASLGRWVKKRVREPGVVFSHDYKNERKKTFVCIHCRAGVYVEPQRFNPAATFGQLTKTTKQERTALALRPIVLNLPKHVEQVGRELVDVPQYNRKIRENVRPVIAQLDTLESLSIIPMTFRTVTP